MITTSLLPGDDDIMSREHGIISLVHWMLSSSRDLIGVQCSLQIRKKVGI